MKDILDKLVLENELTLIDIKTYRFTGDINRKFENAEPRRIIFDKSFADKRDYLEQRRQELVERMQKEDDAKKQREEEFDKQFAEYERFLKEQLGDIEEDDDDFNSRIEYEAGQKEKLIDYLQVSLQEERKVKPREEIPEHLSWDDENDFIRFCGEQLMELVSTDKKMGRQGALNKAIGLLEEVRKIQNQNLIEVYEFIVFALQNMGNYYYLKIRNGVL
ncbi:MAG: hypothetical protein K2K80_04425 [Clostridia bacterium]|nr:hypothetical protein [Clostridia bacterium]